MGGGLSGNRLDANIKDGVEKARTSERGKYLTTAIHLSSDRRRYGELILSLKNYYAEQQHNYPKNLTDMYGLMVVFAPKRAAAVAGGHNEKLNFGNVVTDSKAAGIGDDGSGGEGDGRRREFWHCGGNHLKINCPKLVKDNTKKDEGGEKCTDGKTEVKVGYLYTMLTSLTESTSGGRLDSIKLGERDEFTW